MHVTYLFSTSVRCAPASPQRRIDFDITYGLLRSTEGHAWDVRVPLHECSAAYQSHLCFCLQAQQLLRQWALHRLLDVTLRWTPMQQGMKRVRNTLYDVSKITSNVSEESRTGAKKRVQVCLTHLSCVCTAPLQVTRPLLTHHKAVVKIQQREQLAPPPQQHLM